MAITNRVPITVVIPHLNQADMLADCLASLMAGARAPDQIIVVDNGSRVMPEVPDNVTLLREDTPGPGPARNLGMAHATGDILAFIDADCIADPGWLAAAEGAFQDPNKVILGGDVRIAYADPAAISMIEAYESIYGYRMDRYIAREGFTGTGNLVVRRPVLETVGPFAGLSVAEDRDWGQRATGQGLTIHYIAAMRVYHPARPDMAALRAKWDRQMAHDFGVTGRVKWIIKTLAMGLSPLAEVPRVLLSDRVTGLRSRALAFAGMTRIRLYRARRMAQMVLNGNAQDMAARWNR